MPRRASTRRGKLFRKLPVSVIARLRKEPWQVIWKASRFCHCETAAKAVVAISCFDFNRISIKRASFQPEIATSAQVPPRNDTEQQIPICR